MDQTYPQGFYPPGEGAAGRPWPQDFYRRRGGAAGPFPMDFYRSRKRGR